MVSVRLMRAYHVTTCDALPDILARGLEPRIGERSEACGETVPRTYFFPTPGAVNDGLASWLGDEFEDLPEDALAIVEVVSDHIVVGDVNWELVAHDRINPDCIVATHSEGEFGLIAHAWQLSQSEGDTNE